MLVQLDVVDSSLDNTYTSLVWSTEAVVNVLANDLFRPARVLANANDDNKDGRADSFNITLDFPLAPTESVLGVQALSFFDFELSDRVRFVACQCSGVDCRSNHRANYCDDCFDRPK